MIFEPACSTAFYTPGNTQRHVRGGKHEKCPAASFGASNSHQRRPGIRPNPFITVENHTEVQTYLSHSLKNTNKLNLAAYMLHSFRRDQPPGKINHHS